MQSLNTMTSWQHFILIIACAVVAFVPRFFPLMFFTKREIPDWFNEWMRFVPVSLFTALVVKGVFVDSKYHLITDWSNLGMIISAVIVGFVSYRTRSMAISVITGLVSVILLVLVFHI